MRKRLKSIGECLFYGVLPWWMYEKKCHHEGWTYWRHLWENLLEVKRLLSEQE